MAAARQRAGAAGGAQLPEGAAAEGGEALAEAQPQGVASLPEEAAEGGGAGLEALQTVAEASGAASEALPYAPPPPPLVAPRSSALAPPPVHGNRAALASARGVGTAGAFMRRGLGINR
jgi:hypothetical protein